MEHVRVGVIGTGRMGQRHCRVFSNLRRVQLVGVYDANPVVGYKVAQQYDAPFFDSIDELLKQVDAVSLATPTFFHHEQAMLCISKGLHVLVEKPITRTLDQAEALVKAAKESGLVVQIGHIERFNPAYIELKNILEEYQPLSITLQRLSPYQGSNKDVDVVMDLMIHDANLMLDLLKKNPTKMSAYGLTAYSGTIDHAIAQLIFEGGPMLTMTSSRLTEEKIRKIDVTCREAYIECDLLNKSISVHRSTFGEYLNSNRRGVKYRQEGIIERINIPSFEPLFLQLQHFVDCILEEKTPYVTAQDGYDALKLTLYIRDCICEHLINMDRRKTPRVDTPSIMIEPSVNVSSPRPN
ncbi:MAG TPA: Gfo/Idh/MocA family oxidoreductase [Anaerolineales bacterium]